ncbi:GNAT family N-acetyltransferase [Nonomuraea typhae]|uniref:GNAT family N-acetyltransferase n=1 Tax=Nonomuraea typhae TaxID=2603600 RepID=UPI0012FABB69|nr:GNAT family N-acetyltransferase [Nonomuraea typhae]
MDVVLRPVTESDLDVVDAGTAGREGAGDHQWFGHRDRRAARRNLAETGLLTPEGGRLTIVADGEVAGYVKWFIRIWGPRETSWCWSIALSVLPAHRGRGVGTAAQRRLTACLRA